MIEMSEIVSVNDGIENGRPVGRFFISAGENHESRQTPDMREFTSAFVDTYSEFMQSWGMNITRVQVGSKGEFTNAFDGEGDYGTTLWLNFRRGNDLQSDVWQLYMAKTQYDLEVPKRPRGVVSLIERQFAQPGLLRQQSISSPETIAEVQTLIQDILEDPGFDGPDGAATDSSGNERIVRTRIGQLRYMRQNLLDGAEEIENRARIEGRSMTVRETKNRQGSLEQAERVGFPVYNMDADYGMPILAMPQEEYHAIVLRQTGKSALQFLEYADVDGVVFGSKSMDLQAKDAGEVLAWLSRDYGLNRTAAEAVLHIMYTERMNHEN